ncbi:MAG: DUF1761 domain-containing protein [Candidatus Eremiobacteraeota bacterium]|nr:DUF1761 domain-containing protein [Candidatus Eremiobacteraeota bacterium]
MPIDRINWLAVIVGGILYYGWGALWYGVLGQQWLTAIGPMAALVNPKDPVPYVVSFVMALLLSFGVAVALSHDDNRTMRHGIEFGLFFGLLFFATTLLTQTLYEGHPLKLWLINAGYEVIGLVILGALHGAWKKAPKAQAAAA